MILSGIYAKIFLTVFGVSCDFFGSVFLFVIHCGFIGKLLDIRFGMFLRFGACFRLLDVFEDEGRFVQNRYVNYKTHAQRFLLED